MKCSKCGSELSEGIKFCPNCGTKVEPEVDTTISENKNFETEDNQNRGAEFTPVAASSVATPKGNNNLNLPLVISLALGGAAIAIGMIIFVFFQFFSAVPMTDEKAIVRIEEAVAEIQNFEYDAAGRILSKIKLKSDSHYTEMLEELKEIASAKPVVVAADTSDYPNVEVEFKANNVDYAKEDIEVLCEDYTVSPVSKLIKDGKTYKFVYAATEDYGGETVVDRIVFKKYKNVDFAIPFDFVSKNVSRANLSLITSNVENYPEISLFFKAVDEYGEPLENLTRDSFVIKEYLNVNDYLERDVIYAAKVDGKDALNVSLAIDRSSSISDVDMNKIKNATNVFLSKLQFNSGDKAEIVSFESNVMQMCLFTNNRDNLMNGVNSMYPYGLTACYDAIVTSIHNASVQSGARCVIVFTDGMDNESVNTVDSVIRLAQAKSVPVYTIGVGRNLIEGDLRRIANSTGGTYHHIDDISAMSQIYEEIYREQKNLYHVKYISDTSLAQNEARKIDVNLACRGYRGACSSVYTPIVPVAKTSHNSRYEVIKADISWEEANRACIERGGHLATITSRDEEQKIIAVAEKSGISKLWIGGYTTNNQYGQAVGHWVMGEPFTYQNWFSENEPSRFDSDNEAEFYLMLWKIDGRWSWNDQRNDLINSPFASTYKGKMGYVIEYED